MTIVVLVLAAVASAALAAPRAPTLLRLEVAAANDGSRAACNADDHACDLKAGQTGLCRFTASLCVRGRAGIARVRVRRNSATATRVVYALSGLPGASPTARGARFSPPLPAGCTNLGTVDMPAQAAARLVLGARTADGRAARTRLALACGAADPTPPAPPPPPPPPPPGPPEPLRFGRIVVDAEGGGQPTSDVGAGDIDGDGLPDVVVSGYDRLLWYHNPEWTPHPIADGAFGRGGKLVVRDVDGDGRLDLVTGLLGPPASTVWLRNTGDGWVLGTFSLFVYCHDLVFGDLDGDGRDDAVCVDQRRGQVLWLEPPTDPAAPWTVHTIDPDEQAMGAAIADIDRDGRQDVVVGRAWYRNEVDGTWTRHEYTDIVLPTPGPYDTFRDYAKVSVLDLDGDGRLDVFATLYAETPAAMVYAFLAPADPVHERWTPVPVDPGPLFGVHSQAAAAFDGSSRPQIFVGETGIGGFGFGVNPSPHLYVYRLLGAAADPAAWERTTIDTIGTHEAQAVDLDGDGRPDLIGHQENMELIGKNGPVNAWRNETLAAALGRLR